MLFYRSFLASCHRNRYTAEVATNDKPVLNTTKLSVPGKNQAFCRCLALAASPSKLNPNPVKTNPPTAEANQYRL